jgi:hypothetical protein
MLTFGRNPFGRYSRVRETAAVNSASATCAWCGSKPRKLYRYGVERDDSTRGPSWDYGIARSAETGRIVEPIFCNVECRDSYCYCE